MGANQGIAGTWPGMGVIYRTREVAELDAARGIGINVGAMANGTEVVVRQPAVERESCDSAFAKVYRTATDDPHGLTKNVEPVVVSDTVAKTVAEATANVVAMIRKVHEAPAVWDPFSVQQDGVVSKLKAMVGHDEVGVIGTENGKPVIKISKRA